MDPNTEEIAEAPGATETSRTDDIAAAFDQLSADPTPERAAPDPAPEGETPAEEEQTQKGDRPRDEQGRFAKATEKPVEKAPPLAASAPPEGAKAVPGQEATPPPPPTARKPPQSWKPDAREVWQNLPARVQEEVERRERETAQALNESAEARRHWQRFTEAARPYEAMLRASGGDPVQSAEQLFRATATLQLGTQQQKADLLARMVKGYGVDIGTLENALIQQLNGQTSPQAPTGGEAAPLRDPRLDILLRNMEAMQQREIERNLEKFKETHEFFEDVRWEMGEFIKVAGARGLQLTEEEAYKRAVALHPEIQAVLEQRKQAAAAAKVSTSTQRSRAASNSLRSAPVTRMQKPNSYEDSRSDDIRAALEELEGR